MIECWQGLCTRLMVVVVIECWQGLRARWMVQKVGVIRSLEGTILGKTTLCNSRKKAGKPNTVVVTLATEERAGAST